MPESRLDKTQTPGAEPAAPWQVPVARDDIPDSGRHYDLAPDTETRARIARIAGLRELPRLEASFDVSRRGSDGLHVTGRVSATVGQTCVVTLEPLANEVQEAIDLVFMSSRSVDPAADVVEFSNAAAGKNGHSATERNWSAPEPLSDGVVDLGALAIEFLILGIDPYPRKPGAVFEPPADHKADDSPFAALAKLTKGRDGH